MLGGFLVGAEQDWNECAASYKMEIIEHIQKMRAIGIAYDLEGWLENIPVETLRALKRFPSMKSFLSANSNV